MDNREAVNWLTNVLADIGKAEHSDLWHYEQVLTEIKDMLESTQPVLTCKGCKYDYYEYAGCRNCLRRERDLYESE